MTHTNPALAEPWPLGQHSMLSTIAQSVISSGGHPLGTPVFNKQTRVVLAVPPFQRGFPAL